jgi:hypothetical protein
MALVLNLFKDLKNGIAVGNAFGIVERPVSQPPKLPALGTGASFLRPGQSIANCLLLSGRQTVHKFNNLQGDCAHERTFAELVWGVKRVANPVRQSTGWIVGIGTSRNA